MDAITVKGLRKRYGDHWWSRSRTGFRAHPGAGEQQSQLDAVGGIDLSVGRGEIFALLGPNGAGKTTTVEILEGHRFRDDGDVEVLGEDPGKAGRHWRARIGIVLQTVSDAAELTVRETVRHFAKYYPESRNPDEVIELVGLTEKVGARVRTLSGGQRRRLDVALGVIGRPELVFLDEPTTGFDPEARRQFWDLIRMLAQDGTTILLTTHYLDEAEALADRVAVIVGGVIVAEGTPATLGGRDAAKATVSWVDGTGRHSELSDDPAELIHRRVAAGERLAELTVTQPSLEDTYLELIGSVR